MSFKHKFIKSVDGSFYPVREIKSFNESGTLQEADMIVGKLKSDSFPDEGDLVSFTLKDGTVVVSDLEELSEMWSTKTHMGSYGRDVSRDEKVAFVLHIWNNAIEYDC